MTITKANNGEPNAIMDDEQKDEAMKQGVETLHYNKKDHPSLFELVNEYTGEYNKHVTRGTKARNAIQTYLEQTLPAAIEELKKTSFVKEAS